MLMVSKNSQGPVSSKEIIKILYLSSNFNFIKVIRGIHLTAIAFHWT